MAITKTLVEFTNVDQVAELAGDLDPATVKEQFAAFYPFLANSTFTTRTEGDTKIITFTERLGTKG